MLCLARRRECLHAIPIEEQARGSCVAVHSSAAVDRVVAGRLDFMLTTGWSWAHQHHQQQLLLCGGTTTAAAATTTGCSNFLMMAMMRRPPVRCQALADSMLASARAGKGLAMSQRDLGASRQCGDIPTETLSLDPDFVVINKVRIKWDVRECWFWIGSRDRTASCHCSRCMYYSCTYQVRMMIVVVCSSIMAAEEHRACGGAS